MVKVKFDFREFVNRIRADERVEKMRSINENPTVKEDIYTDIYTKVLSKSKDIPKDSTALLNSPNPNAAIYYKSHTSSEIRYPNGSIDSKGITYNPYSYRNGEQFFYADYVMPSGYQLLNLGTQDIRKPIERIVRRHLVLLTKR